MLISFDDVAFQFICIVIHSVQMSRCNTGWRYSECVPSRMLLYANKVPWNWSNAPCAALRGRGIGLTLSSAGCANWSHTLPKHVELNNAKSKFSVELIQLDTYAIMWHSMFTCLSSYPICTPLDLRPLT